ncbi:DUF4376 domain-containing protein [Anaeroselena agilis]|uniref:DUF4376 domain-containing protein n=1 Tax=Anaeroselena agilis TaxID=3063788 RepID=A0ABU3NYE3_9FIRM|nr:DUF4376 domain-containing protein [Selenomonadales bacterium 4137-cl]
MKIYHYHPDTGIYLGEGEADKCPVSGVNLIPAFATSEAPPAAGENQYAAFENGAWVAKNVQQPGPDHEPTPAEAAIIKRAAINAERNRREQLGFTYLDKTFDSDQTSVIRINAAVNTAVAAILSEGSFTVTWTCADNTTIDLDAQHLLALAAALAAHSDGLHQTARTLKAAVDAALDAGKTAAEIEALPTWTE